MTTNTDQILEVIESAQTQFDRGYRERAAFTAQITQAMALQQIAGALSKIETAVSQSVVDQAKYQIENRNLLEKMLSEITDIAISQRSMSVTQEGALMSTRDHQAKIKNILASMADNLNTLAGTVREYEGDAMFRVRHYD